MLAPVSSNISLSTEELAQIPIKFLDFAKIAEAFDWMVNFRRKIHENPELGFEEFETNKLSELIKGIPYNYPVAVTGIVGYIGSGQPPFVTIRADMDALAIQEAVEWEHKNKVPGQMHACGHDAHVAMLLGAAKLLQEHRHEIRVLDESFKRTPNHVNYAREPDEKCYMSKIYRFIHIGANNEK